MDAPLGIDIQEVYSLEIFDLLLLIGRQCVPVLPQRIRATHWKSQLTIQFFFIGGSQLPFQVALTGHPQHWLFNCVYRAPRPTALLCLIVLNIGRIIQAHKLPLRLHHLFRGGRPSHLLGCPVLSPLVGALPGPDHVLVQVEVGGIGGGDVLNGRELLNLDIDADVLPLGSQRV